MSAEKMEVFLQQRASDRCVYGGKDSCQTELLERRKNTENSSWLKMSTAGSPFFFQSLNHRATYMSTSVYRLKQRRKITISSAFSMHWDFNTTDY